ncbi:hypothetical protein G9A89_003302 [Geosiphon pyriformis]|nr:hypothetical protein G9A89_003302 [Geosiphon pyriformis]
MMEPVGLSAGGSGLVSAGLGTHLNAKKNQLDTIYSHSASYKKLKKSVTGNVVDSSAGPLSLKDIGSAGIKSVVSWGSEVGSITSSVGEISDVENMANMIAEKTSYVESSEDDNMDETTPRKTHTQIYVLRNPPKQSSFNCLSDDNNDEMVLPPHISFNSSKSFVLDIELLAVSDKTVGDKLICIKKIFYHVDGFGGASTSLKFSGIIKSSFTSESSINKAKELAICEKIAVNNTLKKISSHLDKEIVVKEIPVDLPKLAVESVFSKFRKVVSIKMQLIGLWQKTLVEFESSKIADLVAAKWSIFIEKDSVCVVKAIDDKQSWALLYTLSVGITAYNLSNLLELYGGKTCFIGRNPSSYVRDRCAIVCFNNEASKLAAIAGLSLACCAKCKQFGHVSNVCSIGENSGVCGKQVVTDYDWVCLANIYKKKQTQVADDFFFLLGSLSSLSAGSSLGAKFSLGAESSFNSVNPYSVSGLFNCLASVEWSLKLLSNQVSDIMRKLSFVDLMFLLSVSHKLSLTVSIFLALESYSDMILDSASEPSASSFSAVVNSTSGFSSSSSKILTTKFGVNQIGSFVFWFWFPITFFISMSGLVWKFAMCNVQSINVPAKQMDVVCWHISSGNMVSFITETKLKSSSGLWIKNKYDGVWIFTFGLDVGYLGAGVAVVMNNSLACYISKVEAVLSQVILVWLLFKSKISVTVLSLYTSVSAGICLRQVSEVNFIIAKAVNTSTFVVLGGDFNECNSGRSVSFKFCSSLDLVNSFNGYYLVKTPTWCNSRGVERTIDYIFVSGSLSSTVVERWVSSVSDFFDMDHNTVAVLVGLNVDSIGWSYFRDCSFSRILVMKDRFLVTAVDHNLNAMWSLLEGALIGFVNEIFSRQWFSDFQCSKNKWSSKFLGLKLLITKISTLDVNKALVLRDMIHASQKLMDILKYLSIVRKEYRKSKMYELKLVQEASIRAAIGKCMEKFCLDKNSIIRNVLDRPFQKVVLDYLVVNDELMLDPKGVKLNVDRIMESWMRKHVVPSALPDLWAHQYVPLDYVQNNVFSGMINAISMGELLSVVSGLPNGKATGLSGILNKLWKHGDKKVTECLLVLLNKCLFVGAVPVL